ncbi:MAG: aldo/keto reductase [Spirochaetaceae bacterium]|jgi:predicted aldo/keto reductase-like oxidoreductase|nr:aldo/keto reductase [Spirochaetaceae bacterium]
MMQYRKDEKSGNKLSVLGFGCMRFPRAFGVIDMKKTSAMVREAVDRGVNYFDTAWIYPGSEEALGAALAEHGLRDKVYIASKLPVIVCKKSEDFDRYFLQSLERLKTDRIDYYLMHMLTDINSWEKLKNWGIEDWIRQKKESGALRQAGFSFHGARDDFLAILSGYDWDFCQIQYNYSDENYQAGRTGLKAAAEKGIPVIIMEPLLGGRLIDNLPKAAREAFKKADPAPSLADWGLNWLWNQAEVTVILSGMSGMEQLQENIGLTEKARAGSLSPASLAVFDEVKRIFNSSRKVNCTACAYCMPCPQQVNIPGCFAAYNTSFAFSLIEGLKQYVASTGAATLTHHMAGLCIKCGKCEKHCPQNIKVSAALDDVKRRLEPFWVRAALSIFRSMTGRAPQTQQELK